MNAAAAAPDRWKSGLYLGVVSHSRVKPVRHSLRYRVFMMLLDLDEVDEIAGDSRVFGRGAFRLLSFHDRDHGIDDTGRPGVTDARRWVDRQLAAAGLPTGGPVRVLCFPRVLGYVFNPLAVWFCHPPDGGPDSPPMAILYQVSNTFGERHGYLLPATVGEDGLVRHACAKRFFVSPFMDMAMTYAFRVLPPGEKVAVTINEFDADGLTLSATLTGSRRPLSDAAMFAAWLSHPLMTAKVMAGIHWEALWLWAKGLRLRPRPPRPAEPVSITFPNSSVHILKEPTR